MKEGETSESRELLVAMATVKDWLLTKGRDAGGLLPSMKDSLRSGLTFAQVVVTPDNIPEFTIPRPTDGGLSPRLSIESQEVAMLTRSRNSLTHSDARSDGKSDTSSPYLSPCGSREASPCLLQPRAPYVSRSAPSSPLKGAERAQGAWEPDDCQATNVDPFSLTAMSLPHLKAVTNFGFETLSEPPHTRRKESLFHDGDLGGGQPLTSRLQRRRVNSADGSRSPNSLSDEDIRPQRKLSWRGPTTAMETDCRLGRKQSSKRRNVPSLVAPLGVVLPQQRRSIGETSNPLLLTTPSGGSRCTSPTPGMGDFARLAGNGRFERGPTRRRSGSLGRDDLRYLSTEHSAGPDTQMGGHILVRRNSCAPNLMDAAHSTKVTYLPTPASNERLQRRFSCQSPPCACVVDTDHLGDIKLSFRHDASTHQLHVTVQRAESLVAPASHKELRPFAKICLLPGKMQKQSTAVVKHTRAPEWNQDLVFRDVNKQQLEDLRVRVKVCSKLPNPRRALCLGEATIALRDLDMDGECTLWKALEPKLDSEELGSLQLSLCFHPSVEKLDVSVLQVRDLPRNCLTGPPDPYVRVELAQPNRPETRRQTRIRKKCTSASYNEDFLLPISPKIEDLNFTALIISVYDHEIIRSDDLVGQVRLGFGATEILEFDHWNQVLQNPGQEFTMWHTLMEAD